VKYEAMLIVLACLYIATYQLYRVVATATDRYPGTSTTMTCEYLGSSFILLFFTAFCSQLCAYGQLLEGKLLCI